MGNRVRTTIEPGKVLEVDDAELVALHRQHLLHSFERSENTDAAGLGKSPNRWRNGEVEEVASGLLDAPAVGDDNEGSGGA
jgi:hypothetical protein